MEQIYSRRAALFKNPDLKADLVVDNGGYDNPVIKSSVDNFDLRFNFP